MPAPDLLRKLLARVPLGFAPQMLSSPEFVVVTPGEVDEMMVTDVPQFGKEGDIHSQRCCPGGSMLLLWPGGLLSRDHRRPSVISALPHQKSSSAVYSSGGGDGPRITSVCHCSSRVSKRWALFSACLGSRVRICNG